MNNIEQLVIQSSKFCLNNRNGQTPTIAHFHYHHHHISASSKSMPPTKTTKMLYTLTQCSQSFHTEQLIEPEGTSRYDSKLNAIHFCLICQICHYY